MKNILEKKHLVIALFAAILALVASSLQKNDNLGVSETIKDDIRIFDTTNAVQDAAHTKETIYTGNNLPAELFEIPFQVNDDGQYLSNKELVDYLGGEDMMSPYLVKANEALMLTFAQNGAAIKEEAYIKDVCNLYNSVPSILINGEGVDIETYALSLYGMYVDNHIAVEGDFITDSSLVWQAEYAYYVRGILTLDLVEDERGIYGKTFGIPLNAKNKKINLVVQVRFMPGNAREILGIDILGAI